MFSVNITLLWSFFGLFFSHHRLKGAWTGGLKKQRLFLSDHFLGLRRGSKKNKNSMATTGVPISLRSSERALGKRRSFTVEMFFCDQYWDTVIDGSKILNNHQGCMKPCKWWDKLPTSTGAGFFKSIVWLLKDFFCMDDRNMYTCAFKENMNFPGY